MEFRNETNGNYARVINDNGTFVVLMGYEVKSFESYGNQTITNKKSYKSEKTAIKKAEQHTA